MDQARKTLLLVDDTLTVRLFEKITLGHGFDYVEAGDGRTALDAVGKRRPDLILLDVTMPVLDGIETLRALKSEAATSSIPVLMVTTKSEDEVQGTCNALGCQGFVTKPIDREELRAKVQQVLGN